MSRRLTFRAGQRLRLRRQFDRVFARRCSAADELLVVYVVPNELDRSRIGLRVGRRLGGAVVRNRIKRRLRETFRLRQHSLPAGLDIVLIPKDGRIAGTDLGRIGESLDRLIRRAARRSTEQRGSP